MQVRWPPVPRNDDEQHAQKDYDYWFERVMLDARSAQNHHLNGKYGRLADSLADLRNSVDALQAIHNRKLSPEDVPVSGEAL